jgi:ribonuclease HI
MTLSSLLKIVQINLNNCRAAMSQLTGYIIENGIDVAIIQDPYTKNDRVVGLPRGWNSFYSNDLTAGIVIVKNNLLATLVDSKKNVVIVSILMSGSEDSGNQRQKFFVISQYTAPSKDLEPDLREWCEDFADKDCLIGGDFNAKNVNWGYDRNDDKGDLINDICNIYDYYIINNRFDFPTYYLSGRKGYPDLTLTTSSFKDLVLEWHVDLTESCSDHRYIRYEINLKGATIKKQLRYKTKHFSNKKFEIELNKKLVQLENKWGICDSIGKIDETLAYFYNVLYKICNKIFKKKMVGGKFKLTWWSKSLRAQRSRVTALFKKLKRTGRQQDIQEHNRQRALYKKQINIAKKWSWKQYCNNTEVKFGKAFDVVRDRYLNNSSLVHTRLHGMALNSDYVDIYDRLIRAHFSTEDVYETIETNEGFSANADLGKFELKRAVEAQSISKAPGTDLIDPRIVRLLFKMAPNMMNKMFNSMLRKNYFPRHWKIANVVFFTKKDKDVRDPRSYRPVCLLQTLSKVLERIVNNRLTSYLEKGNHLHEAQYGFRECRNTTMCLYDIINEIESRKGNYKYTAMVSIDFAGAFDTVNWSIINDNLQNLGVNENLAKIIKSFLSNRQVGYQVEEDWQFYYIDKGCPQGSCLGPTLWTVVADKILKSFDSQDCKLFAYADDFVMVFSENTRLNLEVKGNRLLRDFYALAVENRLTISENKTKVILFGKDLSRRYPIFRINDKNLKVVDKLKHLGIVIDSKLSFLPHLEYLRNDLINYNTNLSRVGTAYWGVRSQLLRVWYDVVVSAKLEYGIQVWYPRLNIHGRRKLESIQRTCLKKVIRCYNTVSNQTIFVLTGVPPLTEKAPQLCKLFNFKRGVSEVTLDGRSFSRQDFEWKNLKFLIDPRIYPRNLFFLEEEDEIMQQGKDFVEIYTDGSKNDTGVGLGFLAYAGGEVIFEYMEKLRFENSVFQAEALALVRAIEWFRDTDFKKLLIITDSQSSFMALQNICPKSQLILDFLNICEMLEGRLVSIRWQRAHVGNIGNEAADALAKASIDLVAMESVIPYPGSFLRGSIKRLLLDRWQNIWENSGKGRYTYSICPKVSYDLQFMEQVVIYFVTGHGSFPEYLYRIGKKEDHNCPCGVKGDALHYVMESCSFSRDKIKVRSGEDFYTYFKRIEKSKFNMVKLKGIYNKLNQEFSFIFSLF